MKNIVSGLLEKNREEDKLLENILAKWTNPFGGDIEVPTTLKEIDKKLRELQIDKDRYMQQDKKSEPVIINVFDRAQETLLEARDKLLEVERNNN